VTTFEFDDVVRIDIALSDVVPLWLIENERRFGLTETLRTFYPNVWGERLRNKVYPSYRKPVRDSVMYRMNQ
jgi:hypothetical protein